MKRNIYMSMSILWIALGIFLTIFGVVSTSHIIGLSITLGIVIPIVFIIANVAIGIYYDDKYDKLPFIVGVLTFRYKKIYHSELGTFFIQISPSDIRVFEQKIFYSEELFTTNYYDVVPIAEIKSKLDKLYHEKLKDMERVNKSKIQDREKINRVKDWDGYLDKQGRIDNKIDKIIN